MGWVVNLAFSLADLVVVFMTDTILSRLKRSSHVRKMVQVAGGTVLIGLGAHLAIART